MIWMKTISSSRCLVPECGGLPVCNHQKETLWDKFFMGAPRRRAPSELSYSDPLAGRVMRSMIRKACASNAALSRELGIKIKTVSRLRKRDHLEDAVIGPKDAHSTVLSIEQEAVIVAFRRYTLLPLDDCLYALQPIIPSLMRSSLHRCLQRHGIMQIARGRRRQAQEEAQAVSDCVLPHRYC